MALVNGTCKARTRPIDACGLSTRDVFLPCARLHLSRNVNPGSWIRSPALIHRPCSTPSDMAATSTLRHPTIGNVIGNADSEGLVQYLGLQYATLADRFAPPQLKQYSSDSDVDATRNG
jgi:hypothetical protein